MTRRSNISRRVRDSRCGCGIKPQDLVAAATVPMAARRLLNCRPRLHRPKNHENLFSGIRTGCIPAGFAGNCYANGVVSTSYPSPSREAGRIFFHIAERRARLIH